MISQWPRNGGVTARKIYAGYINSFKEIMAWIRPIHWPLFVLGRKIQKRGQCIGLGMDYLLFRENVWHINHVTNHSTRLFLEMSVSNLRQYFPDLTMPLLFIFTPFFLGAPEMNMYNNSSTSQNAIGRNFVDGPFFKPNKQLL